MPELTVRPSGPADAEAVERLRIAGWRTAYRGIIPDEFLDSLVVDAARRRRFLEQLPDGCVDIVAVDGESVVGWIAAGQCRDPDRHGPRHGEVRACYVHPGRWRKGVGRVLMEHGLAALAQAGRDDVTLWVLEANDRARRFYETLGFGLDGARKLYEAGRLVPEVRYWRRLAG